MTPVILRPIPGWAGYFAGSDGQIWSARVPGKTVRVKTAVPLKGKQSKRDGYLRCTLCDGAGGGSHFTVHRLVALAWYGPCPDEEVVMHLNDNKRDNRPENLQYGTRRENYDAAVRSGRSKGVRCGHAKLNDAKVLSIWDAIAKGETPASIGKRFGVAPRTIRDIKNGVTWTHV